MTAAPASRAVVERRHAAIDGLDYFPTPPWATRALLDQIDIARDVLTCWEPAAGCGHMVDVLRERFAAVYASDVHDYGFGYAVGSFVGAGPDVATAPIAVDWVITNPPFNLAEDFLERALVEACEGVALLLRTAWIDGQGRYDRIFRERPPNLVLQFAERVPMVAGRWDPAAKSATAYAWFVWDRSEPRGDARLRWIPTGARAALSRRDDVARFAGRMPRP